MPRFFRALIAFLVERWDRPAALRLLCLILTGASGGACLLTAWFQGVFWLGTTLPVSTGMAVSLSIGLCVGLSPIMRLLWQRFPGKLLFAGAHFTLALHAFCSTWILAGLNRLLDTGLIRPDAPVANATVCCLLTLPLVAIPAALLCGLIQGLLHDCISFGQTRSVRIPANPLSTVLTGSLFGISVLVLIAAYAGLSLGVLGFAIGSTSLAIWSLWSWSQSRDVVAISAETMQVNSSQTWTATSAWKFISAALLGAMVAASGRIVQQLSPVSAYTVAGEWLSLVMGGLCGTCILLWRVRLGSNENDVRRTSLLATAAFAALIPAAFPMLLQAALGVNTSVPQVWLSLLCRTGAIMLVSCPIAAAFATCICTCRLFGNTVAASSHRKDQGIRVTLNWLAVAMFAGGFVVAGAGVLCQGNPATLLICCAWGLCLTTATDFLVSREWPVKISGRLAGITATGLLIAGSCLTENYDPIRSAKILFSTNSFLAWRGGIPIEQLPFLDQGRIDSALVTDRGVLTLWNYGGYQFQLRDSGIPKGIVSTDAQLFPQFAPEMMQAAAPLVLHESPARVLVLGTGSGVALTTALQFPVQQVVALEGEKSLLKLLKERVFPACTTNPLDDDRLSLRVVEPALGVAAADQPYDVIISVADQGALLKGQACLTQEFYRRAAGRLKPNGIFCQRFQFIDAGPEPIRQLARTMQAAFSNVTALEVAAGELLCLATNDPRGLVRQGLLERLQTEHARNTFSQMGLDWSVMLNIPAFGQEGLSTFAATSTSPTNGAAGGRLAFLMPREVLRWSDKLQEVQVATSEQVGRLEDWLVPEESNSRELVRRLSEVTAQQELLVKHSDQYWSYRASLRDQVQNHPRSLIEQVAATDEQKKLHPEDRRRIQYFSALSQAVETRSLDDIQKLLSFQVPYDPLLTYFVHQEAAELLSGATSRDPAAEFRLRLHAVYFTSPQDRSLRNVLHALKLLRENPEIEPDSRRRWDHFNSLLQMLQGRWQARIGVPSTQSAQVILGEVNTSILETEKTFDILGPLAADAGLSTETWPLRRRVLEMRLIRPLKEYHSVMFNHQQQLLQKRQAETDALDVAAPSIETMTP